MVAMNPQTWDKDVAGIEPGGYLLYDSTKPMPQSKFRDDITVIGVPLTEICNREYTDPRQRQLFKNIIYVGALSALLDMDVAEIEKLIGEQFRGKEKLIDANKHALHLGRDWATMNLECPIGLRAEAQQQGRRPHLHRGQPRRGARRRLWRRHGLRLVSDHAVVVARRGLRRATASGCASTPRPSKNKFAIVQAEDELASIGMVIGAAWNGARAFTATSRPRHLADAGVPRARLFRRNPGGDLRRAARRPVDRHADAHAAIRHHLLRLCLARRHQARAAVSRGPGRTLRVRRAGLRSRRPAADADLRHARSRHRHERPAVRAAHMGRQPQATTAAR